MAGKVVGFEFEIISKLDSYFLMKIHLKFRFKRWCYQKFSVHCAPLSTLGVIVNYFFRPLNLIAGRSSIHWAARACIAFSLKVPINDLLYLVWFVKSMAVLLRYSISSKIASKFVSKNGFLVVLGAPHFIVYTEVLFNFWIKFWVEISMWRWGDWDFYGIIKERAT